MFVPFIRTGIGWFLGGLVLVVGVLVAVWRAASAQSRPERRMRIVWAVSALALLSVLAFRNAWWLVTFCVLGALGCGALAMVGGRQVRSILFSVVAAPYAGLRGLAGSAGSWAGATVSGPVCRGGRSGRLSSLRSS